MQQLNKLSDGMPICKHEIPLDSYCDLCGIEHAFTASAHSKIPEAKRPAKHICLWGAPGTGKSTIAAGVFYEMKKKDYDVELVQEFAKDLVFSKDFFTLKNQLYIFARQSHPWYKLDSQVDYVVHDSPFLMGLIYAVDNKHLPLKEFSDLVVKSYKNYDTLNIFLLRNPKNRYTEQGRMQSEDEAYEKQNEIAKLLLFHDIPHVKLVSSENTVQEILSILYTNRHRIK